MKINSYIFIFFIIFLFGCTKVDKLEANNQEFVETVFSINESITYTIPNSALDFTNITIGGTTYNLTSFANCADLAIPAILTFGLGELEFTLDYDDFIPTENPNPLADLAHNIKPKNLTLELVNITDCDFSMMENLTLYFVMDSVSGSVSDFTLQNPADLNSPYDAVKVGEYPSIPEDIGSTMTLEINDDAILDQFIHAGTFQTYITTTFDKAFTATEAIINVDMELEVTLKNEP